MTHKPDSLPPSQEPAGEREEFERYYQSRMGLLPGGWLEEKQQYDWPAIQKSFEYFCAGLAARSSSPSREPELQPKDSEPFYNAETGYVEDVHWRDRTAAPSREWIKTLAEKIVAWARENPMDEIAAKHLESVLFEEIIARHAAQQEKK